MAKVLLFDCFLRRLSVLPPDSFAPAQMGAMATAAATRNMDAISSACAVRAAELLGTREISRVLRVPAAANPYAMPLAHLGTDDGPTMLVWTIDHEVIGLVPAGVIYRNPIHASVIYGRALVVGTVAGLEAVAPFFRCARPSEVPRCGMKPELERCPCGHVGAPKKACGRCRCPRYCNTACQTADWTAHRPACKAAVAVAAESIDLDRSMGDTVMLQQPGTRVQIPRAHTFRSLESALLDRERDERKVSMFAVEYNHAQRRNVVLLADRGGQATSAGSSPKTDVTDTVRDGMVTPEGRAAAAKWKFELHVQRGNGEELGDELLENIGGETRGGHGFLLVTRLLP